MTYCETCGHGMCVCPKKPVPTSPNESFIENMRRRTVARDENDHLFVIPISEVRQLLGEYDALLNQLPEGMKHCTIEFKECAHGHGRLTATNWVQHDCQTCRIETLEALRHDGDV